MPTLSQPQENMPTLIEPEEIVAITHCIKLTKARALTKRIDFLILLINVPSVCILACLKIFILGQNFVHFIAPSSQIVYTLYPMICACKNSAAHHVLFMASTWKKPTHNDKNDGLDVYS